MRVRVLAVGRLKAGPERELVGRYLGRARAAGAGIGFGGFEVEEFVESRRQDVSQRREEEASTLLARSEGAQRIVLDERGKPVASADLATLLGTWRDQAASEAAFLIGGPDGHAESARKAGLLISLGPATWPHQLLRAMLAEQLYRAVTILSGHPYHRA